MKLNEEQNYEGMELLKMKVKWGAELWRYEIIKDEVKWGAELWRYGIIKDEG